MSSWCPVWQWCEWCISVTCLQHSISFIHQFESLKKWNINGKCMWSPTHTCSTLCCIFCSSPVDGDIVASGVVHIFSGHFKCFHCEQLKKQKKCFYGEVKWFSVLFISFVEPQSCWCFFFFLHRQSSWTELFIFTVWSRAPSCVRSAIQQLSVGIKTSTKEVLVCNKQDNKDKGVL